MNEMPTEINGLDGLWIPDKELTEKWSAGDIIHCPQCGSKAAGIPWGGSMLCDTDGCGVGIGYNIKPVWFRQVKQGEIQFKET